MADDDDEMMEPDEEIEGADELDDDVPEDVDPEDLDDEVLVDDDDDEFVALDDEAEGEDDDDDAESTGPVRKSIASDDEDDDDDMLAPDDVEADLDTILKDRLVANDDEANEEEEDEAEDKSETGDRIQPKRADEKLCPSCFLLVRQNAPICPVGDDECPLFR